MHSDSIRVNAFDDIPVHPPELVIEIIEAAVVPIGSKAVIVESSIILNVAFIPLNSKVTASVKLLPVIVTNVLSGPLKGANDVSIGASNEGS